MHSQKIFLVYNKILMENKSILNSPESDPHKAD